MTGRRVNSLLIKYNANVSVMNREVTHYNTQTNKI